MSESKMNPKVDFFFDKAKKWQQELEALRSIVLESDLAEELKWGVPCYTYNKRNVVLIHAFKDYCALLFHKGALLKDPGNILIRQTEHVQAARQVRFTGMEEVKAKEEAVRAYIREAIAIERSGAKVELKKTAAFSVPEEFQALLDNDAEIKSAFEALTPGRQRGYLLYFSSAKQAKTRESRIGKYLPKIMEGKGLDD